MTPRLLEARYVGEFTLHLRFADGTEGNVDLARELHGEVFEPLREKAYFRRFSVSGELHTVVWPNGADFAPEFLYDRVRQGAPRAQAR